MKTLITVTIVLLLSTFASVPTIAMQAEQVARELSAAEMQEDIGELARNIKANHPRPFRIISEQDFDLLVDKKITELGVNPTRADLLWAMSEVLASIGCSHSRMPFFNQEDELIQVANRFPIDVRMHEGRLYVIDPLINADHIYKGQEIVSINGVPIDDLREEIFAHMSADVGLPNIKEPEFNISSTAYITFALDFPTSYSVKLRGHIDPIVLRQLRNFEYKPIISPFSDCQDRLCYRIDVERNIGIMTIRSFDYYGADAQKFFDFTKSVFDDLGQAKRLGLLIDARGIPGGSGVVGRYLLRHIADKPFEYFDPKISDRRGSESAFTTQLPIKTQFNGPKFILMDGMTASAVPHFFAIAKENKFATLVGQPAGGGKSTTDGKVQLSASNSGIKYTVARMRFDAAAPSMSIDEAVTPDIYLPYSLEDILNRTDSMRTHALDLLGLRVKK